MSDTEARNRDQGSTVTSRPERLAHNEGDSACARRSNRGPSVAGIDVGPEEMRDDTQDKRGSKATISCYL